MHFPFPVVEPTSVCKEGLGFSHDSSFELQILHSEGASPCGGVVPLSCGGGGGTTSVLGLSIMQG